MTPRASMALQSVRALEAELPRLTREELLSLWRLENSAARRQFFLDRLLSEIKKRIRNDPVEALVALVAQDAVSRQELTTGDSSCPESNPQFSLPNV